ncbi:hypothetical protein TVAG_249260 [Trichomonas vaginalis G3]|uniref:Uncharacterized protein n=1 Tax=Trichomonas vaginalis (strain ATCC PRA-98 / G3) TaxID=412133 RepID=A2DCC9_TRIV3|nr:hypothetical protein TVAGG3_0957490 [Trichomonas vaginalis G3]EAY21866.1 hypothetical protein TVAG_249260 [Trichomonas vaginalis G3]KAI5487660.1 hypothetical protein TVAGG3_0957490 [Trichomonas vaginalis G3]|eukprot:XP_001582852.1 hypothetical protein [Trichomonas vaginalis G3]
MTRVYLENLSDNELNTSQNEYMKRIKSEIKERSRKIDEYEKEIERLKEESNNRSLNITDMESVIRHNSTTFVDNAASYLDQSINTQNNLEFQEVNHKMNNITKDRELETMQFKPKLLEDKLEKLNNFVNVTSQNIQDIHEKRDEIIKILNESQINNQSIHDSIDEIDQNQMNQQESAKNHLILYNKMIGDLKTKIESENTIFQDIKSQYTVELGKYTPIQVDTFEKDVLLKRVSELQSKIQKLEEESNQIANKKAVLLKISKEKEQELTEQKNATNKHKKNVDSLNVQIFPPYVVKLCKRIGKTKNLVAQTKNDIEVGKFAQKDIAIELSRLKKYLKSVERKIGREAENFLNIAMEINKSDSSLIIQNANEENSKQNHQKDAKEFDRIAKRKMYLESEWEDLFNHKYAEYKLKNPKTFPNNDIMKYVSQMIEEERCQTSRINIKIRDLEYYISILKKNINDLHKNIIELRVESDMLAHSPKMAHQMSIKELESKIDHLKHSIEQKRAKISERDDKLTRVEKANNIYSHHTPFIFIDIERVCDRKNLRYMRITDCILHEQKAESYVKTLENFLKYLSFNSASRDLENYSNQLTQWLSNLQNSL